MSQNQDNKEFEQSTDNVLSTTLRELGEGITGIALSSKNERILSISHLFQRIRGGQFLSQLLEEWNRYREKGKVKDDYQSTEQHKVCLQELLDFLENDSPDETRFEVLKKIFLVAASEEFSDRESLLPQQFMKIARRLSSGEVIVLITRYKLGDTVNTINVNKVVAKKSGLQYRELVAGYEQKLLDKKLMRQGERYPGIFHLSDLGSALCKYISHYEEVVKE